MPCIFQAPSAKAYKCKLLPLPHVESRAHNDLSISARLVDDRVLFSAPLAQPSNVVTIINTQAALLPSDPHECKPPSSGTGIKDDAR